MATCQHGDRARLQRCLVGSRIDAARKARDHHVTGLAQLPRQALGEGQAGGRCIAGADDGDAWLGQHIAGAAKRDQGRRSVDGLEGLGIIGLAHGDEAHAQPGRCRHLLFGLRPAGDLQEQASPAAGEIRQGLKGRGRAAVLIDQGPEGSGADILRADEAKPVETLLIRQNHGAYPFCPILPSVPARRRLMFSLCFHQRSATRIAATSAIPGSPKSHRTTGVAALATRADREE